VESSSGGGVRSWLASPRRRRRLAYLLGALGVGAVVAAMVVVLPQNNGQKRSTARYGKATIVAPTPKTVRLGPGQAKDARSTAAKFVQTAVLRRNVDDSWELTAPELRVGFTRETWARGEIPVVPFPAEQLASVRWKFDYSIKDHVGLEVAMLPRPHAETKALVFAVELVRTGPRANSHWLVDYWAPLGPGTPSPAERVRNQVAVASSKPNSLSAAWLGLLAGLFVGGLFFVPVTLVVRGRVRRVRAERAYRSTLSE
jgi:hypothetical protein